MSFFFIDIITENINTMKRNMCTHSMRIKIF